MTQTCSIMERRRNHPWREISIVPTSLCTGGCKFCFLNKSVVGDRDWGKLYNNVISTLSKYDYDSSHIIVRIFGGELFMDQLVVDPVYRRKLTNLFSIVHKFIGDRGCFDIPLSLENISKSGVDFAKILSKKFNVNILVPFSTERIKTREKEKRYWENLERLDNILRIGILMTSKDDYVPYIKKLSKYAAIDWEEPVMMDGFSFSYKNIKLKSDFPAVRCVSNHLKAITSRGVFTCAGFTRKPSWIEDKEWDRLCNDLEYLDYGYQQVLDWYGCNDCEKQNTCPGMCWKTYYAQKHIYKNRKCLYK